MWPSCRILICETPSVMYASCGHLNSSFSNYNGAFSQMTEPCTPLSTLLDQFRLLQEQYPWARATIVGGSPSTSCIVFRCYRASDGTLVNDHSILAVLESQPEGTEVMQEIFILPYFDIVGEKCFDY
ncbi:hypothetical protein P691DRAFT_39274 [Macrolepiota fuliginosa MF-IS2]|uniref:Uncharacterized protein n=1 Tax=Macrolepiota fuliginosa MF-IS2 TaxID=1400762 RepID=A0A9P5WZU7_9AGAR|nr:hypothetical protein P691DRAFT_39274 [Macrolepiota fuliginosa MF-IS2]